MHKLDEKRYRRAEFKVYKRDSSRIHHKKKERYIFHYNR